MKGWGPKSSICPSKPGKPNFFGGISRDFAGISRKCPKSLRKKGLCSIFVPYVYLFFLGGVIPSGGGKHINKLPPEDFGQPREYLFFVCA